MKCWTTKSGVQIHRVLQGRCNCYLVSRDNRFLLIDAGTKRSWHNLEKGLNQLGVTPESPIPLVLTHCHFDHAENAARFKSTYNASILVHKNEADDLKRGRNPRISGTLFPTRILSGILYRTPVVSLLDYEPVECDVPLQEEIALEPLGFPGCLLHTPGHTPGSISAIIDDEIAIVGDTMVGFFPGSVFPPFAVDVKQLVNSWRTLLDTGCETYLPAHGSERSRDVLQRQYNNNRGRS